MSTPHHADPSQAQLPGLARLPCHQFKDGGWRRFEDEAAPEVSVTLAVDGVGTRTLWAFPSMLGDLAMGHTLLDICPPGMIPELVESDDRTFRVRLKPGVVPAAPAWPGPLHAADILAGAGAFMDLGGHWEATGCFHRAALYDPASKAFVHHVEDIGRHNCLDRLAGWALARDVGLQGRVLFVTARATASLVAKAVRTGYAMMVSRSAVTTAGADLAAGAGMTLLGFSRENRFSVFADAHGRIAEG